MLKLNDNLDKRVFVVNNFYSNPEEIREFAYDQEYLENTKFYKGLRSTKTFLAPGTKEAFEAITGETIKKFDYDTNGVFQITSAENPQVYHCDAQKWAGMVYLTPNAPIESGTRTHRSKHTGGFTGEEDTFKTGFYDSTQFDVDISAGNVFNRLVIFNGQLIHSAGPYFGSNMWNGRLIHLFFWD